MKRWTLMLLALVTLSLAACGDEEGANNHEEESVDEEACEHMAGGPTQAVTSTADATDAPDVSGDHTRYDLTFVDDGNGMNTGYASFESTEAAEYLIFTNNLAPLSVLDANGDEVTIEESNLAFDVCTEVAAEYLIDLEVETYTLVFGPTDEGAVSIVIEEAGGHEDHE